jgi:hypothetical protein
MDNLIDNALQQAQAQANIIKNRTCVNRYIGYCWDYDGAWDNSLLEWFYIKYNKPVPQDKKVAQKCRNKICVNPEHLIEVSHDEWFKHTLDKELAWMNYV